MKRYTEGKKWYEIGDINGKRVVKGVEITEHIVFPFGNPGFYIGPEFSYGPAYTKPIADYYREKGFHTRPDRMKWYHLGYCQLKVATKRPEWYTNAFWTPALTVIALGCEKVLDRWLFEEKEEYRHQLQLLTNLKPVLHPLGNWFTTATPKPAKFSATVRYDKAKHHLVVDFNAPTYQRGCVSIQIAEMGGTITDRIIQISGPGRHNFRVPLAEEEHKGRGGRHKYVIEQRKNKWKNCDEKEFPALLDLSYMCRFWVNSHVRYVIFDPDGLGMLIPENLNFPNEFHYELLHGVKWNDLKPCLMYQIQSVRSLMRAKMPAGRESNKRSAFVAMVMEGKRYDMRVRRAALEEVCASVQQGAVSKWDEYIERTEEPGIELFPYVLPLVKGSRDENKFIIRYLRMSDYLEVLFPYRDKLIDMAKAYMKAHYKTKEEIEDADMYDQDIYEWLEIDTKLTNVLGLGLKRHKKA